MGKRSNAIALRLLSGNEIAYLLYDTLVNGLRETGVSIVMIEETPIYPADAKEEQTMVSVRE